MRTLTSCCAPHLRAPTTSYFPLLVGCHIWVSSGRGSKRLVETVLNSEDFVLLIKARWWKMEDHWYWGELAFEHPVFIKSGNLRWDFNWQINFCFGSSDRERSKYPQRNENFTEPLVFSHYEWEESHLAWCAPLCTTHDACPLHRGLRRCPSRLGHDAIQDCFWCHYAISSSLDAVRSENKRQELHSLNYQWFLRTHHSFIRSSYKHLSSVFHPNSCVPLSKLTSVSLSFLFYIRGIMKHSL